MTVRPGVRPRIKLGSKKECDLLMLDKTVSRYIIPSIWKEKVS